MCETTSILEIECGAFSRYLTGVAPAPYVVRKYVEAHADTANTPIHRPLPVDRFLLPLVRRIPALLGAADAYTAVAARDCLLRKKLVLLMAILESTPEGVVTLDSVTAGSRLGFALTAAGRLIRFAATVAAAALLLGPLHAYSVWTARRRSAARRVP